MFSPTALDLENIFQVANLVVLPFWALMVLLPQWSVTQRLMQSYIPFAALASLYVYLFVTVDGSIVEAFSDPNLKLDTLAGMFANSHVMATGWVHYLVMDLFVGRWIYQQGLAQGIFTRHSLALCLFAGPLGLLTHFVTAAIAQRFFSPTDASPPSAPSAV
ncbi:MAG TPA: ABA4-like family protein [Candidatus Obscuribacterales bacterium]